MNKLRGVIAGIGLVLLTALPAGAASIVLSNGSKIDAVILKETDELVFVDIGFTVLAVPKGKIKQRSGGESLAPPAPNVARFFGPPAGPGTDEKKDRIYRQVTGREWATLEQVNASDVVKKYNESVVVVSAGRGWGTGFFIDKRGYVITNHHVIGGNEKIDVTLLMKGDGGKMKRRTFKGVTIVASNRYLDLALLKLDEKKLKSVTIRPVVLENIEHVHKGDTVFAIGNPGLGAKKLSHTISEGIISSKARNINGLPYVQTTAAVNPGNSGGPLFNSRGLLVGVVTLKAFYQEGIGFALPSNYVIDFIRNREAFAYKKNQIEYLDPPKKDESADKPKSAKKAQPPTPKKKSKAKGHS